MFMCDLLLTPLRWLVSLYVRIVNVRIRKDRQCVDLMAFQTKVGGKGCLVTVTCCHFSSH